jgi:PAS domain S-box-containing protein
VEGFQQIIHYHYYVEKCLDGGLAKRISDVNKSFWEACTQVETRFLLKGHANHRYNFQGRIDVVTMEFKAFFDALPLGVFIVDAQGHPVYANLAAIALLGKGVWPEAAIEHLNIIYQAYQAGTNQLYPMTEQPLLLALQGESCRRDDIEIHHGGQIIPIEVTATPIVDGQGQIQYALAVLRDLRDHQQHRQQQSNWQQDLVRRNHKLMQENTDLKRQLAQFSPQLSQKLAQ